MFRLFETAYDSFESEGNAPETAELIQKALYAASDAGFSAEEIEAINAQILLKNQDAEDGYSAMARKFAEYHLRRTARNTIQIGRSVEDFLAKANASYDKFLQEEKQRNPGFDDAEARLQSSLMHLVRGIAKGMKDFFRSFSESFKTPTMEETRNADPKACHRL